MMAAYYWALDDAFRDIGIEIPLPQRDVRLCGFFGHQGPAAIDAISARGTEIALQDGKTDRFDSMNDASVDNLDKETQ